MNDTGFRIEHRYLELPDSFYTRVQPKPLTNARMVTFNHELARQMGFHVGSAEEWTGVGPARSYWKAWTRWP